MRGSVEGGAELLRPGRTHYVYILYDGSGSPIYVGKGTDLRAYQSRRARKAHCYEIAAGGLTEGEAFRLESLLIGILGRSALDSFGILTNRWAGRSNEVKRYYRHDSIWFRREQRIIAGIEFTADDGVRRRRADG